MCSMTLIALLCKKGIRKNRVNNHISLHQGTPFYFKPDPFYFTFCCYYALKKFFFTLVGSVTDSLSEGTTFLEQKVLTVAV